MSRRGWEEAPRERFSILLLHNQYTYNKKKCTHMKVFIPVYIKFNDYIIRTPWLSKNSKNTFYAQLVLLTTYLVSSIQMR